MRRLAPHIFGLLLAVFLASLPVLSAAALTSTAPAPRTLQKGGEVRLCATSVQDLDALERVYNRCYQEMAWTFAWPEEPKSLRLVVCYDVQPPAGSLNPLQLGSNLSFEENVHFLFREMLVQLYADRRRLAFAPARLRELDWIAAGLTYGFFHRAYNESGESALPNFRPLRAYYASVRPFSFAAWVDQPIPPGPSLGYEFYGLNSLFLMQMFGGVSPEALPQWLRDWGSGTASEEAARRLLAPEATAEAFDAELTAGAKAMLQALPGYLAPEEFKPAVQRCLAVLKKEDGHWLSWKELREASGRERISKAQKQFLDLATVSTPPFRPAALAYADACGEVLRPGGWFQAETLVEWTFRRRLGAAADLVAAQEERQRQVNAWLDRCEMETQLLRHMVPTLFRVWELQEFSSLSLAPALTLWLDEWEKKLR